MARLDIWDMTGKRTIIAPHLITGSLWVKTYFSTSHDIRYNWYYVTTMEVIGEASTHLVSTANVISFEIYGGNPIERAEEELDEG